MRGALLGPQSNHPTLRQVVRELGHEGPVSLVTCGWQEREDQDGELHQLLGKHTLNLRLYHRGELVLAQDKEYAALHRARQERLRQRQESYRIRLRNGIEAALEIARLSKDSEFAQDELRVSVENIRHLDESHLAHCREVRQEFEARVKPLERDVVAKHHRELSLILKKTPLVAIAGGHVAVLLNRMRLFGLADLLKDRVIVAWSGGAMITGERVVLFHESPPQGVGISEVMDEGLGLHHGVLPLPNPRMRLRLDDPQRVGWMAMRYAPDRCVALDTGEWVRFEDQRWFGASGTQLLKADGTVAAGWAS